ncbi:hypothetical protein MKW92_037180 [Papaver armeniacum]|nr:hypothetical protein MKW92_037180 [Papaver armeniacum]
MEGAKLPVEDQTETFATSTEVKTFYRGIKGANFPIEDRMEGANFPTDDGTEGIASFSTEDQMEAKTLVSGMEGVNFPIGDLSQPVATPREAKTFIMGMEGAAIKNLIKTDATPREAKTFTPRMEGAGISVEDRIETVASSREGKTLVTGMETVNLPIEDQIEPVATSREMKTFDRGIEGANFPTEDRINPVATSREAGTFVRGIQGANLPIENQIELVAPSSEVKSLDIGMEGANFPTENQIEPIAPSRETETFVRGTEGAIYPIKNRIEPIVPSRETETWMEHPNFPIVDQMVPVPTCREEKTLVLFGRVGNGKSAVGNSILGKKEFVSRISASGVTTTCKLGTTMLDDGQVVNVIDTPGLFDLSRGSDRPEYLANEVVKCITLAKDGIHGFILVCSIKTRFSIEEEGVILSLGKIFGEKIFDYMVVVFTGGDELDSTLPEYISMCPSSLQTVLQLCKNRVVLFDNKTKDGNQRKNQVQQLMKCVGKIRDENGQPYKSEAFERMKKEALGKHVHGAQNSKNYTAQQKSSDWGYGNETSREKKVLEKELRKAKKTSQRERQQIEKLQRENEILKLNQQDRGGNIIAVVVRELKACAIM